MTRKTSGKDPPEFTRIFQKYRGLVFHICYTILDDQYLAEDVLQDVFGKFYRVYDRFQTESHVRYWLAMVAKTTAINLARRLKGDWYQCPFTLEEICSLPGGTSPEDVAMDQELSDEVGAALRSLDHNYADVLRLKYYFGFKTREIAKMMDIPLGTACTWLSRGTKKLERELKRRRIGEGGMPDE